MGMSERRQESMNQFYERRPDTRPSELREVTRSPRRLQTATVGFQNGTKIGPKCLRLDASKQQENHENQNH
jgi:hypothetical protein